MISRFCRTLPPPSPKAPRKTGIPEKIAAFEFADHNPSQSGPNPGAIRAPIPMSGTELLPKFSHQPQYITKPG